MMNIFRGIIVAFVTVLSTSVNAEIRANLLEIFHYWQVHAIYEDNKLIGCAMTSELGPEPMSEITNSLAIFHYSPMTKPTFNLELIKEEWNMPVGVDTKVILQIDGRNRIFKAVSNSYKSLVIDLNQVNLTQFFGEFSNGRKLLIGFEGNEKHWSLSLLGSSDAESMFHYCADKVKIDTSPLNPLPDNSSPLNSKETSPIRHF